MLQVFAQPLFGFVEMKCKQRWATSKFVMKEHSIRGYKVNMLRLFWRTSYVMVTTVIAMIFPFFNSFLGLIGAISFYPLTVYFPIEMHLARSNIPKYASTWLWLKMLSFTCLVVSLVAGMGSIQGLLHELKKYQVFEAEWLCNTVFGNMKFKNKYLKVLLWLLLMKNICGLEVQTVVMYGKTSVVKTTSFTNIKALKQYW